MIKSHSMDHLHSCVCVFTLQTHHTFSSGQGTQVTTTTHADRMVTGSIRISERKKKIPERNAPQSNTRFQLFQ